MCICPAPLQVCICPTPPVCACDLRGTHWTPSLGVEWFCVVCDQAGAGPRQLLLHTGDGMKNATKLQQELTQLHSILRKVRGEHCAGLRTPRSCLSELVGGEVYRACCKLWAHSTFTP